MAILTVILIVIAAIIVVAAVITIVVLGIRWLKTHLKKRLEGKEHTPEHQVGIAEVRRVVTPELKEKLRRTQPESFADFEKSCSEKPYLAFDYDPESDEISNYEAIKPEQVEQGVDVQFAKNDGIIMFES